MSKTNKNKDNKDKKRVKWICKSTVKSMGFSDKMIEDLLPKPKVVKNPHYSRSSMYLWDEDEVLAIKKTAKFKNHPGTKRKNTQHNNEMKKVNTVSSFVETKNPANDYPLARSIKRHFILNIGETNTGKTYRALQALKTAESGVYLSPLRLLAMEVQDDFLEEGILCSMVTGEEENIIPGAKIMSSTVEKLNINKQYDVGVIDECQMVEDNERGSSWTRAILGCAAKTIYLCMSENAKNICIKLIEMCGDTYEICRCKRKTPLEYTGCTKEIREGDAYVVFSRRKVLEFSQWLKQTGHHNSVVYGALPYKSRKEQVKRYNDGFTKYLVTTDAIGMGLNMPIKRIVFVEGSKFDGTRRRPLNASEVKQIAGRAGRYGIYDEGEVAVWTGHGIVSDYDDYSFFNKNQIIREGFELKKLPDIETIPIPFPETIINEMPFKISEIIKLWLKVEYPKIFRKPDMSQVLDLVKYLETTYPKMSKDTIFSLANVVFDKEKIELFLMWQMYCKKFVNGAKIEIPTLNANDLEQLELYYKKLDLYYSFCKNAGVEVEKELLDIKKEETIMKINSLLISKKEKKKEKKQKST